MVYFLKSLIPMVGAAMLAAIVVLALQPTPSFASFSPTIVKTIQCGDIAVNNGFSEGNSTLSSAVVVAKTFIVHLGNRGLNAGSSPTTIDLASTTLVHAERQGTTNDLAVNYCAIEFF